MSYSQIKPYYMVFKATPTSRNRYYETIAGAFVHCVVMEGSPDASYAKARFFISKDDWNEVRLIEAPSEVDEQRFSGKNVGEELYRRAEGEGLAFAYVAWSRDGKTSAGPISTESSFSPALTERLRLDKKNRDSGRCLHFNGSIRCSEFINAHSIQRNRLLSEISDKGHVYVLSTDIGTFGKNKGFPVYSKKGIKNVSTFKGFCKKHDTELFAPIDNLDIEPNCKQVALYAYRSICREYFVKENTIRALETELANKSIQQVVRGFLQSIKDGNEWGFCNLKAHKAEYDSSLKEEIFEDFRYILFAFKGRPTIAFSGLMYPDYSFEGNQIQDLTDHNQGLKLMTICSGPMREGWGYLLAWHRSSSDVCDQMIDSLKSVVCRGGILCDFLFRMAISTSENLAISPKWLDALSPADRERILMKATDSFNIFQPISHNYLNEGLEGLSGWTVDYIYDRS